MNGLIYSASSCVGWLQWMNECMHWRINELMNECSWMYECMNGWMDGWMNEYILNFPVLGHNEWMYAWIIEWKNECMKWMDEWINESMNVWIDGWIIESM